MSFVTPTAALIAVAVVVPLAANAILERRAARIAHALGLEVPAKTRFGLPIAMTLIAALLGVAAAQPVVSNTTTLLRRTDAEAYIVFDTSRSMLARTSYSQPTRFARSRSLALDILPKLGDVPVGIASLTDRIVPTLFPTVDRQVFSATLHDSVGIQRPPPLSGSSTIATDYNALGDVVADNFFRPQTKKKLLIFFSDGESGLFDYLGIQKILFPAGVHIIFVRVWNPDDKIFVAPNRIDPGYHPSPKSEVYARRAAFAGSGEVVRPDAGTIASKARAFLGRGHEVTLREQRTRKALAPFFALAALLPLSFLLLRRNL